MHKNHNSALQRSSPIPYGSAEIGFYDNIPISPEVGHEVCV